MTRILLSAVCSLALGVSGSAFASAPGAGEGGADEDPADAPGAGDHAAEIGGPFAVESRCWDLLETYEEARDYVAPVLPPGRVLCPLVAPPPRPQVPEAAKLEAAEIAAIAEDLLAEGDPETALVLLKEVLVLLGAPPPEN